MAIAAYVKGANIIFNRQPYYLDQELEKGKWLLKNSATGLTTVMSFIEMQQKYVHGELVFQVSQDIPPSINGKSSITYFAPVKEKLEVAKVRRQYVLAILNLPVTRQIVEKAIQQVWNKLGQPTTPPNWVTVARWKAKFIKGGKDVNSIVDRNGNKGRWQRYPDEVLVMVKEAIDAHYLKRTPKTIEEVLGMAATNVKKENSLRPLNMALPEPTRRLVKRMIDNIPAFDRYASQHGMTAAANKFRGTLNMHVTEHALQRVEMDHTPLDLFVLRDEDFVPLGRPYVTTCVDAYTRCVLGIHIGFEPPSYLTVARCLKHAILPKAHINEVYPEIENSWQAHGIPVTLVLDNGQEFHSESLENVCLSLNIQIEYSPRKTPWHKGMIERFQGTMNRAIAHGNPGTTFSNIFEKGDYDPVKDAIITLGDLRLIAHKWISDVYHQRPHSGLGNMPPAAAWSHSVDQQEIRVADDPRRLDVILGTSEQRMLTGKGIQIHSLSYNSRELLDMFKKFATDAKGIQVDLRIDEGDIGYIYVITPDSSGLHLRVPAIDQDYANGISLWMHRIFKRYASDHSYNYDSTGWRQAQVNITNIVENSIGRRKRKSNAKAARYLEASKHKPTQNFRKENALDIEDEDVTKTVPVKTLDIPRTVNRRIYEPLIEQRQAHAISIITSYDEKE